MTRQITVHSHVELIALSHSLNEFIRKLRNMVIELNTLKMMSLTRPPWSDKLPLKLTPVLKHSTKKLDSVVTAMHQMSTTARDVARYAAEAAAESEKATTQTSSSQQAMAETKTQIELLATDMVAAMPLSQVAVAAVISNHIRSHP